MDAPLDRYVDKNLIHAKGKVLDGYDQVTARTIAVVHHVPLELALR